MCMSGPLIMLDVSPGPGEWAKTPFYLVSLRLAYEGCGDGCEGEEVFRLPFVAAVKASAAGEP